MTEKPRFKRAYDDLYEVHDSCMKGAGFAQELDRCYEIIAEAELLAYRMTKGGNMSWGPECSREMAEHARTFLERLSK